jgi:hypothetical protein
MQPEFRVVAFGAVDRSNAPFGFSFSQSMTRPKVSLIRRLLLQAIRNWSEERVRKTVE